MNIFKFGLIKNFTQIAPKKSLKLSRDDACFLCLITKHKLGSLGLKFFLRYVKRTNIILL